MAVAKEILGVDCDGPAAVAIPLVLGLRLEEMYLLRKRALEYSDPEGVHDMRVASRRLRSALRDFMPYLRKARLATSLREVKQVADALGTVRDHDVAIIALEKLMTKASPEVAAGIQLLIDTLNAKRNEHRKELSAGLTQRGLAQLKSAFIQALESSLSQTTGKRLSKESAARNSLSYRAFARNTILDRLQELERLSPSLYEPLRAKPLHKMRIAAKRLRYALELFAACWGESLSVFARQVARLQTDLGELHDCDLWVEQFGSRLEKTETKKGAKATPVEERAAMVWLIGHFTKLRAKHFRSALARWHEWKEKDLINNLTAALEK
jgi:CHAD domain-containing protein